MSIRYAEPDYWEARYQREPALFEWFFGHTALRRIIRAYLSKKKPLLHVGCGTSNLQEGLAKSGYSIVNTDISEVVIKQMRERHAQYSNMTYEVSDCRSMPEFLDCQFGSVIDKGTMDALLCCKQGTENVQRMLREIYRVLQPGGVFLLVTLGSPPQRLPLLIDPALQWKVTLLLLPKIPAANQAYVDGKPINDSIRPIDPDGPYEVLDRDTIAGLPPGIQYTNFFYAFACKKKPLQLSSGEGQKAQLPNGWVEGSKELFQKLQKELGLPEDLLVKGKRTRVMLVPAGSASSSMMQPPHSRPPSAGSRASGISDSRSASFSLGESHSAVMTCDGQCGGQQQSTSRPASAELEQQVLHRVQQQQQQQSAEARLAAALERRQQQEQQVPQVQPAPAPLLATSAGLLELPARPQSAPNLAALLSDASGSSSMQGAAPEPPAAAATGSQQAGNAACGSRQQEQQQSSQLPARPDAVAAVTAAPPYMLKSPRLTATITIPLPSSLLPPLPLGPSSFAGGSACAPVAEGSSSCSLPDVAHPAAASGAAAAGSGQGPAGAADRAVGGGQWLGESASPARAPELAAAAATSEPSPSALDDHTPPLLAAVLAAAAAAGGAAVSCAGAAAGALRPRSPRGATGRTPRVRRFSMESGMCGSLLQPQLAALRQQQAQHVERAADGLVLHDVAAVDSCGGDAAAAAAAVASAAWGAGARERRRRRLSALSVMSGLSIVSSTSISECDWEGSDGGEAAGCGAGGPAAAAPGGSTCCSPVAERRQLMQLQLSSDDGTGCLQGAGSQTGSPPAGQQLAVECAAQQTSQGQQPQPQGERELQQHQQQ